MTPPEEQLTIAELNPDGYIECYEDLDCPDPVEVPENKTISSFSCSGEIKSQRCIDCAQGKYTLSLLCKRYKSSIPPENTKCAMRQSGGTLYYRPKNMNVSNRSNCCLERRDAPTLRSLAESPFS